jgi:hydroxymethylpyrimidine kinase/phosphomethylpyrimidine kinase
VALTIGGSDPSAAAGVQGDIKTFSALGIYACAVVTAITVQNTLRVAKVVPLSPNLVSGQISSILEDVSPRATKIGMIHNAPAIKETAAALKLVKSPIILDPIIYSTTRARLLEKDAVEEMIHTLIPLLHTITPNITEAEEISGQRIRNMEDVSNAAKAIQRIGAHNIIIKGGHAKEELSTDYLLQENGEEVKIARVRIRVRGPHGSGCNFSAALTAFIAQDFSLKDSFELANEYTRKSIENVYRIGRGLPVTDSIFSIYNNSCRLNVLQRTQEAVNYIESIDGLGILIPETQSNLVFALNGAKTIEDVAGVRGRIVRIGSRVRPSTCVGFGSSLHVASAVLAYGKHNPKYRSAMNIRYDRKLNNICHSKFIVSHYKRSEEPKYTKYKEGKTVIWGVTEALKKRPGADIVCNTGDFGKEAMTLVFGYEPFDVINKLKIILKEYWDG